MLYDDLTLNPNTYIRRYVTSPSYFPFGYNRNWDKFINYRYDSVVDTAPFLGLFDFIPGRIDSQFDSHESKIDHFLKLLFTASLLDSQH